MISAIRLSRSGARWVTTMKAMPLSVGMARNSPSRASTPPAEAPIPTIGKGWSWSMKVSLFRSCGTGPMPFDDVGDGVLADRQVPGDRPVGHTLLDQGHHPWGQAVGFRALPRLPAEPAAAGLGGSHAGSHTFADQVTLEFPSRRRSRHSRPARQTREGRAPAGGMIGR